LQVEQNAYATNLRHEIVQLTDLQVRLVKLLDGTRDREALCRELQAAVAAGELVIERYGQSLSDDETRGFLQELVDRDLQNLVGMALLVA
jgi:methyltransferase-like protein